MKIVFFGSGDFGIPTLKSLLASPYEMAAAVTRPDVRKGRGWNVAPTPVKAIVEKASPGMVVLQPVKLSDQTFIDTLRGFKADVFVVVDYGKILTQEVLGLPSKFCINLHPSLLPFYRGPAPVNRAVLNGDSVTGNTVIRMNEKMDAGDIMFQEKMEIGEHDTADVLSGKLSLRGAALILKALSFISSGNVNFEVQDEKKATYAAKLEKAEGKIEWDIPARELALKVRGLQPWPGAYTYMDGKMLKIFQASACESPGENFQPGEVTPSGNKIVVKAGDGALRIAKLQLEGKKAMASDEFLRGHAGLEGKVLG
jgi:methionyl-tRNA formyltransferase